MSNSFFNVGGVVEELEGNSGPICYGYTMTVGSDGKPVVCEFGNKSDKLLTCDTRHPFVDTVIDEKEKTVKLIAEMPGVEKTDVKIVVENKTVEISAEHGEKKYHVKVPLKHKVDENSAKALYKNGILELNFKLVAEKQTGKKVEVE